MKSKHTAFLFLLTLLSTVLHNISYGQDIDSVNFCNTKWRTSAVDKGIYWKQANIIDLFNSRQEVNIIEIDLKKHNKSLRLAALANSLKKTSTLAQQHHAIVAINGGFFNMKNGGAVDFIKVEDTIVNTTASPSLRANAYFAFNSRKTIITTDSSQTSPYPNVLLSGPLLVKDSRQQQLAKNAFNDNRHPRTAIALKGNKLILCTVDGRNANSQGLNLEELSKILRWYGCHDAMNLDGGGSTTMYIKGQPDEGIVNYPSDNKQFDHLGERSVANIIYIFSKK
ncbi:phosphodiester glycosidase family protein [Sphingobacterium faecale]|uniref:Phosphodiester glycosidase family protein n=1 Tax=Sphingobacterium faecale TaxID=2803775 RepID=A0ABS1R9Z2_9SPHI|nr:phosphodiester glycosidase family protein [Sphingobacterium faecale]MBL1410636.1 phosphodiester glycosidase family protein [Sphingobacterium faecale]